MSPEATIRALGGRGVGVANVGGDTWMVAGALPGEVVRFREMRRRAGIVEALTEEVLDSPHPARDPTQCPHSGECGGCDWAHVIPETGAELKREVAAASARACPEGVDALRAACVHPSPDRYRLRARLHWDPAAKQLGFFAPRSWRVSDISGCRVLSPRLSDATGPLADLLTRSCPEPADLEWLEELDASSAVAALRPGRPGPSALSPSHLPSIEAAEALVNGFHTTATSGRITAGWGRTSARMVLPTPLEVPLGAFFQVNRHLVPALFDHVRRAAGTGTAPVWDFHAGVGFLAAAASVPGERRVTLTEPFRPAARAAQRNLPHADVFVGRTAESYLHRHRRLPEEALVLLDPPRAGLEPQLRRALAGWRPHRIVMLSCDPATWARDCAHLLACGFSFRSVELIDLFPRTHHVEILSVLEPR